MQKNLTGTQQKITQIDNIYLSQ